MRATNREIDARLAVGLLALIVVILGALAWWKFGGSGRQMTAAEAGLGKPMHPGEIPGVRSGIPSNTNMPAGR